MAKAWNSGTKKPFSEKQVIYRRWNAAACQLEYYVADPDGVEPRTVARSWAEHEVCSGNARYVQVEP